MRVAYFADIVELGGAEMSLVNYFQALHARAQRPYEALLIAPREGPLTEAARTAGGDVRIVPMRELVAYERNPNVFKATHDPLARAAYFGSAAASLLRLASALRRWRIDLLHTNGLRAHFYGAAAAQLAGRACVCHVRDILIKRWQLRLFDLAGHGADRVICVSEPARAALDGCASVRGKTAIVHPGRHLDAYRPAPEAVARARAELGLDRCFPVVTLVGQVTPNKGQTDLLNAAPTVLEAFPQARFLIVGKPLLGEASYLASLREQARQLGIADRVSFTGFRSDVASILGLSHVAVTASWQEPYPATIIEAYAAAVPVVATRVGGIPELVRDGETGLLVEPHRPDLLARAICAACTAPLRERLIHASLRFVAESCTVDAELAAIERVYASVLGYATRPPQPAEVAPVPVV
ncbi:MAG: glycosyltransferase family 4 protein [Ktedonobacterales bacterium]